MYAVLVAVELGVSSWVSAQLLNIEVRNLQLVFGAGLPRLIRGLAVVRQRGEVPCAEGRSGVRGLGEVLVCLGDGAGDSVSGVGIKNGAA